MEKRGLKKLKWLLTVLMMMVTQVVTATTSVPETEETAAIVTADTVVTVPESVTMDAPREKKGFFKKVGGFFARHFKDFNKIDTSYIEPQHYDLAAMLQNTNTYETYRISSKSGQAISFAPELTYRIGPYFGWRWVFLGYTFDISHVSNSDKKKEFDLSFYSNLAGIDLYYRKTGDDYKIRDIRFGVDREDIDDIDIPFSGLNVGIIGFNLYYIFNHKKFSYPAAFNQSTVQRRSCGTALMGIGYTRHSIELDYEKLQYTLDNLPIDVTKEYGTVKLDSGLMFNNVKYANFSVSGGYAYNWVFARNWLLGVSLSVALTFNQSIGNLLNDQKERFRDFSIRNITLDGTGRLGLVWNNTKWYAGMSAILHSYNYRVSQFSTNNSFGSLNFYFGLNFLRKKGEK